MKTKKILAISFQSIQGFILLCFVLSLLNWGWLNLNVIGYAVLGIFLIFLNIISWVVILSND